ncbi:MAG TPA: phosphatase PAP2 family protein, partial [Anaerolineales bacterium]|nr:phosphatase PAP2 family protein [Anaerolineales bacterium]
MDAIYQFGIDLINSIQTLSPQLDGLMDIGSTIGLPEFFLVLIPFIYWNIDRRVGIRAMFVMFYFDFINASLKVLFHEPRPFWLGGVKDFGDAGAEGTYGLPSGHSGRTLAVAGYLATQVKRNWFWVIAVLFILLVGISRMYLGVHFPQDVLGGWLLAILVIWAVLKWEGVIRDWLADKSLSTQVALGFLEALGMVLIGFLVRFIVAGTPDPAEWSPYNADARTVTHFFTIAGAVFGAYAGYALMRQYARFDPKGSWGVRVIRFVVGIVGVLVIFYGLDISFASLAADESTLGYILRFIRYAT